ncbi:hypothetical protein Fmac_026877 [Flemingia macrophylla]|uniref:Uncharacterized protein n=1 Tax=Flemingia macrophylla TaxID=520843 RepID=A0ABD1LG27_9FABA
MFNSCVSWLRFMGDEDRVSELGEFPKDDSTLGWAWMPYSWGPNPLEHQWELDFGVVELLIHALPLAKFSQDHVGLKDQLDAWIPDFDEMPICCTFVLQRRLERAQQSAFNREKAGKSAIELVKMDNKVTVKLENAATERSKSVVSAVLVMVVEVPRDGMVMESKRLKCSIGFNGARHREIEYCCR